MSASLCLRAASSHDAMPPSPLTPSPKGPLASFKAPLQMPPSTFPRQIISSKI
eukprot:jgi/Botrbrau1/23525/Bobra.0418s0001.1